MVWLILLATIFFPAAAHAAEEGTVDIRELDVSRYPQVRFYLSLSNFLGGQTASFDKSNLTIREDGNVVSDFNLTSETVGYRLVAVMYPGWEWQQISSNGEPRIVSIRRIVGDWLTAQAGGGVNDYSLIAPEGAVLSHSGDPTEMASALQHEQIRMPAERSLSALLTDAMGAELDSPPRPGMRGIILLLTAKAPGAEDQTICSRARELGLLVFGIWTGSDDVQAIDALNTWASACGGYTGSLQNEPGFTSLLQGIGSQQQQYYIEYRSAISRSGDHALTVAVQQNAFNLESTPHTFPIKIQPPVVAFSHAPESILRSGKDPLQPAEEFEPMSEDLEAEVSFPDGHPRNIVSMRFSIDGKQVFECTTMPCPALRWDLCSYIDSGSHSLQLIVQDELGLVGETPDQKVQIVVLYPSASDIFWARYSQPLVTGLVIVLIISVMVIVPTVIGQRPRRVSQPRRDTVPAESPSRREIWVKSLLARWKIFRAGTPAAEAPPQLVLRPLTGDGLLIALCSKEVRIGTDPHLVDACLSDPSINAWHARLARMSDGTWWVFDMGSVAGTWINWEEVKEEGRALQEADILQVGRVSFQVSRPFQEPMEERESMGGNEGKL